MSQLRKQLWEQTLPVCSSLKCDAIKNKIVRTLFQLCSLVAATTLLTAPVSAAPPSGAALAQQIEEQSRNADFVWTIVAAALVLMMQGGFLLLEAGMSRSKNSVSVVQKNLADLFIGVLCFYFIGFGLMFFGGNWFSGEMVWGAPLETDWSMAFFVFQAVFVATVATIVSGAVAERMAFPAYLICAAVLSAFIYPVYGHWAWGNLLDSDAPAWLADMGFIDFAGSTVVHSMGGWLALAAIICLGARHGRFDENGTPLPIHGHSPVLFGAGALVLFFGWFGFNGGSTTSATPQIAGIILNTILSATAGGAIGMLVGFAFERKWKVTRSSNGMLGGLVGITAGCAAVGPGGALLIGTICGLAVTASEEFILRVLKLDDVVGAVSVHGVCGAIGTLLVAVFALPENLIAENRIEQFTVQAYGVGIAAFWGIGLGLVLFGFLRLIGILRVPLEHEIEGLNSAEHGATLGTGMLLEKLHKAVIVDRDLTHRLDDTGGDEAADIAQVINPFLDAMQGAVGVLGEQARIVSERAEALQEMAGTSLQSASDMGSSVDSITADSNALGNATSEAVQTNAIMRTEVAEVAASVRELRSVVTEAEETVSVLGESITNAAKTSNETAQISARADEIAGVASDLMAHLENATGRISNMIGFIDNVAFQTNMLALNAGVEAARAGESGAGFAVVASEIRVLAEQTKSAADEVRSFIEEIVGGTDNVRGSLDEMRDNVSTMREKMSSIASEASEQEERANKSSNDLGEAGQRAQTLEVATTQLSHRVEEIAKFGENVAQTAQEAGGKAAGVAQLARSGLSEAKELSGIAKDLTGQSENLKKAAGQYRA